MKQTMKNWIDLATEVTSATQVNAVLIDGVLIQNNEGYDSFSFGMCPAASITIFKAESINTRVSVQFTDDLANPADFDALYEEACQWWEQFKTSGHEILIDTQIKNKLNNDTSGQL